jgi:hypothetical protein
MKKGKYLLFIFLSLFISAYSWSGETQTLYRSLRSDAGLDFCLNIFVAAFGGLTHSVFLLKSDKRVANWRTQILIDVIVSAFTGLIVFSLSKRFDPEPFFQFALTGIAGWAGGSVLDALSRKYYGDTKKDE